MVAISGQGEQPDEPEVSVGVSPSGVQRFARGSWAAVSVNGVNRSQADVVQSVSLYVGDVDELQFAKQ
ncbi:MAG: hypothetical protein MI861_24630, partial [Pirellulales bacterium]|nr:hypothetical protein [Pirellulales bacterium]